MSELDRNDRLAAALDRLAADAEAVPAEWIHSSVAEVRRRRRRQVRRHVVGSVVALAVVLTVGGIWLAREGGEEAPVATITPDSTSLAPANPDPAPSAEDEEAQQEREEGVAPAGSAPARHPCEGAQAQWEVTVPGMPEYYTREVRLRLRQSRAGRCGEVLEIEEVDRGRCRVEDGVRMCGGVYMGAVGGEDDGTYQPCHRRGARSPCLEAPNRRRITTAIRDCTFERDAVVARVAGVRFRMECTEVLVRVNPVVPSDDNWLPEQLRRTR